jgi:hypothetical protein
MFKPNMRAQRGIGVAYILTFIALVAIVTAAMAKFGRDSVRSRLNFETSSALLEQSQLIRNRLLVCGVSFPAGDNGTGFHPIYPPTPVSGLLADAQCPGQPLPNNLWTGSGGLRLPPSPHGFEQWRYQNDSTSVRVSIAPRVAGDASALGLVDKVIPRIGDSAARVGDALTVTILQ